MNQTRAHGRPPWLVVLAVALLIWPTTLSAQGDKTLCLMMVDRFSPSAHAGSDERAARLELSGPIQLKNALIEMAASTGIEFRFRSRSSSISRLLAEGKHQTLADGIDDPKVRAALAQSNVGHILVPKYHLGSGQVTVSATILDLDGNEIAQALEIIRDADVGGFEALAKALLSQLCKQLGVGGPSEGFEVYVMPPEGISSGDQSTLDGRQVAFLLKVEMKRLKLPRIRELEVAQSQHCTEVANRRKTGDRFIGIKLFVNKTDDGRWKVVGIPQVFKRNCKTEMEDLFELPPLVETLLHDEIVRESKERIKQIWLKEYLERTQGM